MAPPFSEENGSVFWPSRECAQVHLRTTSTYSCSPFSSSAKSHQTIWPLVLPVGTLRAFEIFVKTWFLIGSGSNRIKVNSTSTIGTSWMIPDGVYRQWDSGSRDLRWRKLVWMKCNTWNIMQLVITCLLVILVATHDNSLLQAMYMQLVLAVQHINNVQVVIMVCCKQRMK